MLKFQSSFSSNSKQINDIERNLKKELNLIKKPNSDLLEDQRSYHDDVLFIHRKTFDELLSNISTFKPLLLQIKEAYENSLIIRDKQIKSYSILMNAFRKEKEKNSSTASTLTEENVLQKNKIQYLLTEVESLKDANEKLRKDTHADHLALSTEKDARMTLSHDIAKLKAEINKLKSEMNANSIQDTVVMRLALDQSRKDLSKVTKRLNDLLRDYDDAVPKRDYELLQNEYMGKCEDFQRINKEIGILKKEHGKLLDEFNRLKDDLDEYKEKCGELEQTGTPRPHWDMCAEFIGGGITRWKLITKDLSSKQRLEVILKELGPTSRENMDFFDGLGFDPIVPEYLQYEGPIRNLRLKQRDLSILINDIWTAKLDQIDLPLQEFLKFYFSERYQQPNVRAEWAYNLYSGCERMLDDPQMKLFWGVLHGNLSQDIYYSHRKQWKELERRVIEDLEIGQKRNTLEEIEKIFRKVFPLKSEVELKNIIEVARKQLKVKNYSQDVEVTKLFLENEEGFERIDLAKELFRQRQLSQEKYVREIVLQLGGKNNYHKPISVENLKRAFAIIDPHIDHIIMESNIRWVYSDKKSNLNMIPPLALRTVANKLMSGNIQRVGPRYRGRTRMYKYKQL